MSKPMRMMKKTAIFAAMSSVLSGSMVYAQARPSTGAAATPPQSASTEISLATNEQYSIPANGIRSYSEGTPGIVDVRIPSDGSRILLVGMRAGQTSLLVIRNDGSQQTYTINVFRLPMETVRSQTTQLLQGYSGVSINQIGGRLFLEGGVANEQQQRRVGQIATLYPGQVESLVTVDPTIVERRINVRVDLYFVELSRQASYVFGVRWPAAFGASGQADSARLNMQWPLGMGAPSFNLSGIVTQALPRIDLASNAGWARVHRQATLVTANGVEAKYRSGGEVNVRVANGLTSTVQAIAFGTQLSVTPRFDPSTSRVDVRVTADISELVENGTDIPGRNISQVETLVNLQLGQSIVLSGMRGRTMTVGSNGLPGLAQIPIVGALFGAQSRRDSENEMVVFVVPTVIEGMSRQAEDRVANALRSYEEFGGNVGDASLLPRPAAATGAATPSR
ncbi:MAG: pilus assembly protein N-terminal domain-containing protein [Deltaproteobacteria bacterium]|nr:pilus assembly protein N-terminal domain-containing protein [Deltaproteobacteria bacterium]